MTTFAQDTNCDLLLTASKFTLVTDPATAGALKLRNQFRLFLGEWFLDTRVGMPYFQEVFVKNPNLDILAQLFGSVITDTPGVQQLNAIQCTFNRTTRQVTVSFTATWNDGTIITAAQLDQPFLVTIPIAGTPATS